ncbi:hypothetical protein DU490_14885 [Halomonas sp. DQ26W]|uniref:HupE/UreJ family protein n=1 Tax=Halomonas sp. DQ26W TaxID=2282311 RepID=UPI000DF7FADD|nr:HupE/UreJ family protein [Halomonas sp. DQ26W]RDB42111.1 hypothetical protein DU490_14885 [Halomonas sp. DQ26W]
MTHHHSSALRLALAGAPLMLLMAGLAFAHPGHDLAHGSEMPHWVSMLAYLAGFTLVTLAITCAGRLVGGILMSRESRVIRGLGVAIAAAGAVFAIG